MKGMDTRASRFLLGIAPLILFLTSQAPAPVSAKEPITRCEQLAHWQIPKEAIQLPTRGAQVQTATAVADADGTYCRMEGVIQSVDPNAQAIHFRVNLPSQWNEKALHLGGGGYDGMLVDGLHV